MQIEKYNYPRVNHGVLVCLQGATASRTFDQMHGRMLELNAAAGIACRMMHETAPVTARRMSLGSSYEAADCTIQVPPPVLCRPPGFLGSFSCDGYQQVHI